MNLNGKVRQYNFIMRRGQHFPDNPELDVSFVHENTSMNKQQKRLNIEIIRVHAIQKQRSIEQIWSNPQQQLCDFFTQYDLFPQFDFNLQYLLSSQSLKLIKSQGKIYFGEIQKKKRQGRGITVGRDGRVYEGEFANNDRNGRGVQIYPNGNFFSGEFMNGKKHGSGKFYWFSLSSKNPKDDQYVEYYEGQWWGGLPDGHGMHQKLNGDLYVGSFKNGLKHGQGKQWYGNGDFYKGQFVNGLPQGPGEYLWQDGSTFKGDFKQGLRNGYGLWQANNDRLEAYKGHYAMDKKSGYGIYVWDNGWVYKGNFQNDYRNGYGELYDGGQRLIYRGFWQNGQQTEKQVLFSHKEKQINFRSVQLARQDRKSSRDYGDYSDKRSKISSRIYEPRPEIPQCMTIGVRQDQPIKKRPLSYNSVKMTRKYPSLGTRSTKDRQGSRRQSTATSKPLIGTIKSNLFVPYAHTSRKRF